MYAIEYIIGLIHPSRSDRELIELNQAAVEGLAGIDSVILKFNPKLQPLYVVRPRYVVPKRETWKDYSAVLKDGHGDCKDFTAIRLAELWRMGVDARAESIVTRIPGFWGRARLQFHTYIRYPDGRVEDPARELGMP